MKYDLGKIRKRYNDGEQLNFVFFWRQAPKGIIDKGIFSQWYISSFNDDGVEYNCAEQYMMAQKALLFDDFKIYDKIMKETNQNEIKKLGRLVKNFDNKKWNDNKYKIVLNACILKFSQDVKLKNFLINTGNAILVEASPCDEIWGIKLAENNPYVKNPNMWMGENLLGFALMEARDIFAV